MFKRILVALDGSARSEQALPVAARLAHASHGAVVLLQVINPPLDYSTGTAPVSIITEDFIDTVIAEENSYLSGVAHSDVCRDVRTSTVVEFGLPAQRILAVAEAQAVDLIVICSHGRTSLMRWMLGSVAEQVITQSAVPVLVVREGGPALIGRHAEAARSFSALVTLDGSLLAEAALLPAANLLAMLSASSRGELHLLQVVRAPAGGVSAQVVVEAQAYLERAQERLLKQVRGLNISLTSSVTQASDIAQAIVTKAEKGLQKAGKSDYDLLVMATHGRGGLERLVMGSVTERVLHSTKLPMLVVRPPQVSARQEAQRAAESARTT